MDFNLADHLPIGAMDIMHMLFKSGNMVKDFKLVGNCRGYSMTLHICNPEDPSKHLSPRTDNQSVFRNKTQSPSTLARNYDRRQSWLSNNNDIHASPICTKEVAIQVCETHNGENDELTSARVSNDTIEEDILQVRQAAKLKDVSKRKEHYSGVVQAQKVLNQNTIAKQTFKINIQNQGRNAMFKKIVNDKIHGPSCVIGMSDDLIIRYNDESKAFTHWIIAKESESDYAYRQIKYCVETSSSIHDGTHTDGVGTLESLLDRLVIQHQEYVEPASYVGII